ncbi:5-formyltetrahydrofolate cyclo-ligase [Colwellia sp. 1_MG-2023]|uniref:5-formyltetrahydrofolate cyclo-ligase n=1 Tax=Colwellia sp. 1_MG-2023 TaxID=3062649 RepID=UPI0026E11A99|nr:5-formyltetrahydrofolate cyclo-ligase [Colwellia sp. 1_MG-2023]MDO6444305.1 5-formyltetrahydrofolate cyclo-ligase [Colwellia sp. 1_MG-2023]
MTTSTSLSRNEIRQLIRQKRQSLDESSQQQQSQLLAKSLKNHPKVLTAKSIAIYLTNDGELNTHDFINECWDQKIKTYLPVLHPFSKGHLLFLHYHAQTAMIRNKYHILEPKLNVQDVLPMEQLDIIFTPLVAFDNTGARLGMGGGYYDRTLNKWYTQKEQTAKPYPIGLAHDFQQVDKVPSEHWDIPIPEIITPNQHFKFY